MPSTLRKYWQELRTLPPTSLRAKQLRASIRDIVTEARNFRQLLDQYLNCWSELGEGPCEKAAKDRLVYWIEDLIEFIDESIGEED